MRFRSVLRTAAILCPYYLYMWLRVDPALIHHVQEPVFFRGGDFLSACVAIPGGVTDYLSAFLGQSYAFPWLGAVVLTAAAGLICAASRAYLGATVGLRWAIADAAPAVLLLVLHNRYRYDLGYDLALGLALLAAAAWARLAPTRPAARGLIFLGLSAPLYWIAGGPFLLCALLCAVHEGIARRPAPAAACLAMGAALPWLASVTVYPGQVRDAYLHLLPFSGEYLLGEPRVVAAAVALYAFVPLAALAHWRGAATAAGVARPAGRHSAHLAPEAALLAIAAALVYWTFDGNYKRMLQVDDHARHSRWERALASARQLTAYSVLTVYQVQRALCHLGRLGDDLLAYPHLVNSPIFVPSPETPSSLLVLCDDLLELGHVNKAEHMAQEALEIYGDRPSILERLVTINVLKGRPEAARVYLGRLEKTVLQRGWAREYLQALDADPTRADDEDLNRVRERMVEVDYPGFFAADAMLQQLLAHNPHNRLAVDLLLGHYLQTAQVEKVVESIGLLNPFPRQYPPGTLPRLVEEALLLFMTQARLQLGAVPPLPLHGRQVSQETLTRYAGFSKVLAAHRGDLQGARAVLASQYADTYWYYYLYRGAEIGVPLVSRATRPL